MNTSGDSDCIYRQTYLQSILVTTYTLYPCERKLLNLNKYTVYPLASSESLQLWKKVSATWPLTSELWPITVTHSHRYTLQLHTHTHTGTHYNYTHTLTQVHTTTLTQAFQGRGISPHCVGLHNTTQLTTQQLTTQQLTTPQLTTQWSGRSGGTWCLPSCDVMTHVNMHRKMHFLFPRGSGDTSLLPPGTWYS